VSVLDIENWMHATNEEPLSTLSTWDVDKGEGRDVAALLIRECVYDALRSEVIKTDGQWQILAYSDSDYDSLKERDINFLGFKLVFKKSVK